jgi:ubiquinone biosynthesis protein
MTSELAPADARPPARERPRRPQIRPPSKIPTWRYIGRALALWWSMLRLLFLGMGTRFRGGDQLTRDLRQARLLRRELERLGGVFVKVGQLLSVRTDQYPWEVCREFTQLLDRVVPFPGTLAEQVVAQELGAPIEELFTRFERQPIAAASIGQVHVGWLRSNGQKVAIKIQRPGIADRVNIDLALMRGFASFVDAVNFSGAGPSMRPTIDELQRIMDEELSYVNEARATYDYRQTLKGRKNIYSPRVYFEYTTDRVLTLEFIEGLSASVLIRAIENKDTEALERFAKLGIDRKKLAKRFFREVMRQLWEHDICHIDPHPGNLILMPDNRICMIDFGAVGYFGPALRARMERISMAFAARDVDGAVEATLASWEPLPMRDIDGFKAELKPVYQKMVTNGSSKYGDPNYKSNGRMLVESARLAGKYGIQPPWDLLRFTRLFWEYDTIVVALYPEFNFGKAVRDYFLDRTKRRRQKNLSGKNLGYFGNGMIEMLTSMPQDFAEMRYYAFNAMRRSEHLYRHSMSKLSYFGKLALDYTMATLVVILGILIYVRATSDGPATDVWLAERLPVAMPWWLCALLVVHLLTRLQRVRIRVTEID